MRLEPAQLRDEIALREASLADAAHERDLGELSVNDFAQIEARELAAILKVRTELETLHVPASAAPSPLRRLRKKRWLALAGVCFALALGVVLYASIGPRQAGNSITGAPTLGRAQEITQLLTEAEADVANGDPVAALSAYRQVLALDSRNVEALTQTGWLDFSAGSASHSAVLVALGVRTLERAVALAPKDAGTRLYYGVVAASTPGNSALATTQFQIFLGLSPSPGQLAVAAPFLKKLGLR